MTDLESLNEISQGWAGSEIDGLLCSARPDGGIIDSAIVSGEWFVIFNDDREMLEGFATRADAVAAFIK